MEMFLLISDNTVEDSTQVALKKFARADYLAYQNKNTDALTAFKAILNQHKGESIEDDVFAENRRTARETKTNLPKLLLRINKS